MAEQVVRIESSASNPVFTQPPTAATGLLYTTLITEVAGVNAANNYLSIFNPVGSGKIFTFYQFTAFPYAGAAATNSQSINVFRTTAASGGTLVAAANINKFDTTQANAIAEVRTGNPTTTNGTIPVLSIPPAITSAGAGVGGSSVIVPPAGASFICRPGEGVVVRSAAMDVDELLDLGFTWSEL